jgi:hypothetical protein
VRYMPHAKEEIKNLVDAKRVQCDDSWKNQRVPSVSETLRCKHVLSAECCDALKSVRMPILKRFHGDFSCFIC